MTAKSKIKVWELKDHGATGSQAEAELPHAEKVKLFRVFWWLLNGGGPGMVLGWPHELGRATHPRRNQGDFLGNGENLCIQEAEGSSLSMGNQSIILGF